MNDETASPAGAVTGSVRTLLRLEGLALLCLSVGAYAWVGEPWWLFAVLLFAPDVSFAGYLGGPRLGSAAYNAAHATIGPAVLFAAGMALPDAFVAALSCIWAAHVGLDRAIGYGLKYEAGFAFTHLGRIGRR